MGRGEHAQHPWYACVNLSLETHQVHRDSMLTEATVDFVNASEAESAVFHLPSSLFLHFLGVH